jgi:hypothetical protein
MNELKDVFVNAHTAPYDITTVNRKIDNGLNSMLVVVYAMTIILVQIVLEKRINQKIREYDAREKE